MDKKDFLESIPFAYAKVNSKGNFLEYNNIFAEEIFQNEQEHNILHFTEEIDFQKKEQRVHIRRNVYSVFLSRDEEKDEISLFFYKTNLPEEHKPVIALIFIDNYDEVLDSLEEFKHPLILAIVDRKIKKLAKDLGGVVRKFEKDKYILLITNDKLNELKESKFDILDSIRSIDMGNTLPVTLSIGLGVNGSTLNEGMEYARVAIDLALGRGGDQAIIKDRESCQFFGGHSKEFGRNSRVRARVKAYALTDLIEEASNVIIMGHKNMDLDCLGAGIGVCSMVSSLEKSYKIVLNNVTSSIATIHNRLIKDDKYKNSFLTGEEALKFVNRKTLLIVVDTFKPSICECPELLEKCRKVVVFDHHRKGVEHIENAVLTYHDPSCSSTCELITEMLMYMNKNVQLKNVEADAILAGIIVDTKNFAFKTGAKTFEAAGFLKKKGADTIRVKTLFKDSLENYNAKAQVIKNVEIGEMGIATSVLEERVNNPILTIAQSADELLSIDGIEASFVFYEEENKVYISARSFGKINVQIIMESLGGGGHQAIAATQIQDISINQAKELLNEAIDKYFKESE